VAEGAQRLVFLRHDLLTAIIMRIRPGSVNIMANEPFEKVKPQIGYCGIWCGSCVAGNGALRELTGRFAEVVENYGLEAWVPPSFDFKEFSKGLECIEEIPLCHGCRMGDGSPDCPMRRCAIARGVEDCIECGQHEVCVNAERLEKMRTGALGADLIVKEEKGDNDELIAKWTEELKTSWPSCILFIGH
jgi:hypothetical protein